MKSIVFFNNKGGVGKTTLACNVVSYLSRSFGMRVLLVDADPQCNATQVVLSDQTCEQIYIGTQPVANTLFDYLAPLEAGETTIRNDVSPIAKENNEFGVDLVPGHPRMSLIEDKLSSAWSELRSGVPAGFRVTNWCSQLFEQLNGKYDLVVFDVGPSLGALNRTVILSSDFLITPFGCDIFSLLGIQNISSWIKAWNRHYEKAIADLREDRPEVLQQYPIIGDTSVKFRFVGYTVQQYVTKTFKTGRRPVKAYDNIMRRIPATVADHLEFLYLANIQSSDLSLGHIPFLYSLVPLAQSLRRPIHSLKESGRLVGNQYQQVDDYERLMAEFCERLIRNAGLNK